MMVEWAAGGVLSLVLLVWAVLAWRAAVRILVWHGRLDQCDVCWHRKWPHARTIEAELPADGVWKARWKTVHRRCARHVDLPTRTNKTEG